MVPKFTYKDNKFNLNEWVINEHTGTHMDAPGWDAHVAGPKFRNADEKKVMHFPGFHVEAARMLLESTTVSGIAVDTLSLDFGPSPDFATHYAWLPSGRWGLEAVANLGQLPAKGATLVVGAPKVRGATGGPCRVFAFA
jgi:kynurenine formamidase